MAVELNREQARAVKTNSHYVRIIAGAGSGKTRVLTMRVAYLIKDLGVDPKKIVAITFTNKAANEMKKRVADLLGNEGLGPHISTIHSLCVRILREDIRNLGYPTNFTVLDQDDQKSILREAYKERGIDVKTISYSAMLNYIAGCKSENITYEFARKQANGYHTSLEKAEVYNYYLNRQREMYALDFDDLLLKTVELFKKYEAVLQKWQYRFQYILVDEFQDIDNIQYEMIRLLADDTNEVYVVGDPDQTIYTWRGANVEIIMHFEKDFSPCETIVLAQNYRSTSVILNAANSLILNNRMRIEKELFTNRNEGQKIIHFIAQNEQEEANWIARKILELKKDGQKYLDSAILYRANYLSRSMEKGLRDFHIPYIVYGGTRFYDRQEIKDMLCYLRMLVTADDLAFKRIINVPKRGLGNKTTDALFEEARSQDKTMYQVIDQAKVPTGAKNSLLNFRNLIEHLKKEMTDLSLDKLLEKVFEESGYRKMLEDDKEDERIANIKELMNDMTDFANNYPDSDLSEYLQMVNLYTDKEDEQSSDVVQLMTIHAAKGLEFPNVFVMGLSQGVFPSEKTMAEGTKGLEEERRLAYVAYTRAKDRLFLTEPQGYSFVMNKARMTSQFVEEINQDYITNLGLKYENGFARNSDGFAQPLSQPKTGSSFIKPVAHAKYRNGDLLTHAVFGDGVVVNVKGNIMDVAFSHPYGLKTLMMNHPAIKRKA